MMRCDSSLQLTSRDVFLDMYSFGAGISGQLGGSGPDGFIPHASPLSMVSCWVLNLSAEILI